MDHAPEARVAERATPVDMRRIEHGESVHIQPIDGTVASDRRASAVDDRTILNANSHKLLEYSAQRSTPRWAVEAHSLGSKSTILLRLQRTASATSKCHASTISSLKDADLQALSKWAILGSNQ
jgi:hypothetical protein